MYYEHHVHLYGCLTAEDVWLLGRDLWQQQRQRLDWYADSYRQCFGVDPQYEKFWRTDAGYELLRSAYEVNTSLSFAQFQAKFNLVIALFPHNSTACQQVWQHVLAKHLQSDLKYAEYRTMYPSQNVEEHFQAINSILAQKAAESGHSFQPRFAVGLARQPDQAIAQYRNLAELKDKLTHLTAIDLCGDEEDYPAHCYEQLFALIKADNARHKKKLALLIHVGESFSRTHIASSIREILQAHAIGAHRLGHATALGIELESMRGRQVFESVQVRAQHLQWLADDYLSDYGYTCDQRFLQAEHKRLQQTAGADIALTYDDACIYETKALQTAALRYAQDQGVIIETCPTSNRYLADIKVDEHLPLRKFAQHKLTLAIASDDPGMFGTDIAQEWEISSRQVSADFLQRLARQQPNLCSEALHES